MQKNIKFMIFLSAMLMLSGCNNKLEQEDLVTDNISSTESEENKVLKYTKPENNYDIIVKRHNNNNNASLVMENYKSSDLVYVKYELSTDVNDSDYNYYMVAMSLNKDASYLQKCYGVSPDDIRYTEIMQIEDPDIKLSDSLDLLTSLDDFMNPEFVEDGTLNFTEGQIPVDSYRCNLSSAPEVTANVSIDKQNSLFRGLNYTLGAEDFTYEVHSNVSPTLLENISTVDFDDYISEEDAEVEISDMGMQFMSSYTTTYTDTNTFNEEEIIQ